MGMIRKGSLVVPLPSRYLPSVYHGKVGKVDLAGKKGEILTAQLLSVEFPNVIESFRLFRKDEVRLATKEEKRVYKFVKDVKQI